MLCQSTACCIGESLEIKQTGQYDSQYLMKSGSSCNGLFMLTDRKTEKCDQ